MGETHSSGILEEATALATGMAAEAAAEERRAAEAKRVAEELRVAAAITAEMHAAAESKSAIETEDDMMPESIQSYGMELAVALRVVSFTRALADARGVAKKVLNELKQKDSFFDAKRQDELFQVFSGCLHEKAKDKFLEHLEKKELQSAMALIIELDDSVVIALLDVHGFTERVIARFGEFDPSEYSSAEPVPVVTP